MPRTYILWSITADSRGVHSLVSSVFVRRSPHVAPFVVSGDEMRSSGFAETSHARSDADLNTSLLAEAIVQAPFRRPRRS
jgi:hypothetical protein